MHVLHAAEAPEIVGCDHCAAVVSREPGLLLEPHREQVVAKPVVTQASSRWKAPVRSEERHQRKLTIPRCRDATIGDGGEGVMGG